MKREDDVSSKGLETLQAIAQAVSHSLDLEAILEKTADKILEFMGLKNLGFFLYEETTETLNIKVYRGLTQEFIEKIRSIRIGEGLTGFAAQQRKIVTSDLVLGDPRSLQVFKDERKQRSGCYIPLISKEKLYGVLSMSYHQFHPFSVEEMQFLETVGNLISQAIENTQLYAELKRYSSELEKMVEDALANIKVLRGMLPICASCKKIRDDKGYWSQIETYIRNHSEVEFSHGICPECKKKLYPDL